MNTTRLARSACLLSAAVMLAACSAQQVRLHQYRSDPTPKMDNMARVKDKVDNDATVMLDTYWRQYHEDLARFFLLDRPTRMDPRRIPY